MATRRMQVRTLCGEDQSLRERTESLLAAIEVWAGQGNAKAVKSVGSGLVPVCAWLAAESLKSDTLQRRDAERASGLTPAQFRNAERELRQGLSSLSAPRSRTANRRTGEPLLVSGSSPGSSSLEASPSSHSLKRKREDVLAASSLASPVDRSLEALRARAMAVQSGAAFRGGSVGVTSLSARARSTEGGSPSSRRNLVNRADDRPSSKQSASATPSTPSGSATSTPKSVRFFRAARADIAQDDEVEEDVERSPSKRAAARRQAAAGTAASATASGASTPSTPTKKSRFIQPQPHTPVRSSPLKKGIINSAFFPGTEDGEVPSTPTKSRVVRRAPKSPAMPRAAKTDVASQQQQRLATPRKRPRYPFSIVDNPDEPDPVRDVEAKVQRLLDKYLPSLLEDTMDGNDKATDGTSPRDERAMDVDADELTSEGGRVASLWSLPEGEMHLWIPLRCG